MVYVVVDVPCLVGLVVCQTFGLFEACLLQRVTVDIAPCLPVLRLIGASGCYCGHAVGCDLPDAVVVFVAGHIEVVLVAVAARVGHIVGVLDEYAAPQRAAPPVPSAQPLAEKLPATNVGYSNMLVFSL